MNLIDRYNKLTPEQQEIFGRMVCAYAIQLEQVSAKTPFMRSQAEVVGDMCVSILDGASLYVPLSTKEVA